MKSLRIALSVGLLAAAATFAMAQTDAQKSFNQLKTLTGSWEGKNSQGEHLIVTFEDTAGGSALLSEIHGHGPENMVSMFHLDGPNRLMLTHYCGAGNQPRMTATTSPDGKTVTFDFLDATNLSAPDAGHMQRLVVTMVDANHHTEDWTFNEHGKEMKELFDLHRTEVAQK
jgi:putative NIF3 family GTP cyclohydrolase 1 type 2